MKHLQCRNNWTPELIYVHRTRLIIGAILGFIVGFLIAIGINII